MTTYKDINAQELFVDQNITCQIFERLRNNPISTAEGNSPADRKYENTALEYSTATLGQKDRLIAYRESRVTPSSQETIQGVPFRVNRTGAYNIHHRLKVADRSASTAGGTIITKVNGIVVSTITVASGAALNQSILINVERRDLIQTELKADAGNTSSTDQYSQTWIYTSNPHTDYGCMFGYYNETTGDDPITEAVPIEVDTY